MFTCMSLGGNIHSRAGSFHRDISTQLASLMCTDTVPHAVPKCGSFWWRSMVKLMPIYRGVAKCEVRNGL